MTCLPWCILPYYYIILQCTVIQMTEKNGASHINLSVSISVSPTACPLLKAPIGWPWQKYLQPSLMESLHPLPVHSFPLYSSTLLTIDWSINWSVYPATLHVKVSSPLATWLTCRNFLKHLAVKQTYRRRGIAQRLLDEAIQFCTEHCMEGIDLVSTECHYKVRQWQSVSMSVLPGIQDWAVAESACMSLSPGIQG